jgi:hypothetical protein
MVLAYSRIARCLPSIMKVRTQAIQKVISQAEKSDHHIFFIPFSFASTLPLSIYDNPAEMKLVLTLSFLLSAVQGSQDSAYYPGFSNPNTQDTMYYRDASNVLQGVQDGDFSALYIKYHGCV